MVSLQRDTLRMFTALRLVRQTWAGSLLVTVGLNETGRALALASLAAGAAAIVLEQDAAHLRTAQREGCCTFSVTSLDEALRIVKNEVRQRRAIAVGLRGDPAPWLREMVERGVQPQAFASSRMLQPDEGASIATLCERGMQTFGGLGLSAAQAGSLDLAEVLERSAGSRWSVDEQPALTMTERRAGDQALLEAISNDTEAIHDDEAMRRLARQWLHAAPELFPRALQRSYWRPD